MNPHGPKRAASGSAITDINVTPLVDVCLVLVIIFMVIAPMAMQSGIEVAGSKVGAAQGEAALSQNVTVALDAAGRVTVDGRGVRWEELGDAVAAALKRSRDGLVSVDATPKAEVGRVVEILDTVKQRGARRVALLSR
ncbi:MAG: biopolymer transporter ExbD [Elusimicrobia bacterium]|nr:biopolymer transporter ExbD [Elusimicrobiota bacterium]